MVILICVLRAAPGVICFDEFGCEGPEEGPDRWDGHGDKDDPFFDFAPAEEDADAI